MRTSITILFCLTTAAALAASGQDRDALAGAERLQLEFRQGNLEVVGPLVESLEAAVSRSPGNAELWGALGNAYMSKLGTMYAEPDPAALIATGNRARDAFGRALVQDHDNALLLASHGMAGMVTSLITRDMAAMKSSIEEMNAAVRQAPRSTTVRLTRGFTIIHLPPGVRDDAAVIEDLNYILEAAPGGRPEDVLHVMLGDVHAETGDLSAARAEYEQVTGASAFAQEQSRLRMEELKKGAVSAASIAQVRSGTGARCFMCHAPGTDN